MSEEIYTDQEPRHEPDYRPNGAERFLGYAGELDVYFEQEFEDEQGMSIIVVAHKDHPKLEPEPDLAEWLQPMNFNYDIFELTPDGHLEPDETMDLHLTLLNMCEIYQLVMEKLGGKLDVENN